MSKRKNLRFENDDDIQPLDLGMSEKEEAFPLADNPDDDENDDALDISSGKYKPFALDTSKRDEEAGLIELEYPTEEFPLSNAPDTVEKEQMDMVSPFLDLEEFPLNPYKEKEEKAQLDMVSPLLDHEDFPLRDTYERDMAYMPEESGEMITEHPKRILKKHKGTGIVIASVAVFVVALMWIFIGFLYTGSINRKVYSDFKGRVSPTVYNSDFDFFLTFDEKTQPIVKSEKERLFRTFNNMFFMPGTLTSSHKNGIITVTGSSHLIPSPEPSLVGEKAILERVDEYVEYTVTSVSEEIEETSDLAIYIKNNSSKTGITVINMVKNTNE